MSSSLRRGALAASAIAFSIASLAACGAGNNSQTLEIKPDNAATSVGDIKIQNAVVITQPDPEATGPAVISATVFNSGSAAQTLDSITVDGVGTARISPATGRGTLSVPAGGSVIIGGKNNASAVLSNGEGVTDGDAQKVTFSFSRTGDVSLRAFVVPAESYFTSWGPTEVPAAPGASASTSEEPAEGTEGASGSPNETGSATGTPADPESGTPTDAASASVTESPAEEDAGH
ncbi:DUF461 domain-containing protein [Streptomyces sp. PSKA30]|uniref:DUF461 domain-containing protein n=1 Tax=Streptomyces sp. PSKA30 TaxID=2874597 RepID=UPI001CD1925C|nr:DUF461 domain-containing protein [Streptomyces sp. PSKA30]MBZ9639924.1 DUF461 domain-containing protein [Streptomyces sp. PSKA30]